MTDEREEQLLSEVKNYLNITWHDGGTDEKIRGIMLNGIAFLNLKIGAECDYLAAGLPRSLLFDYCRYARDEALDIFENNYLALIVAARNKRRVKDAKAAYAKE